MRRSLILAALTAGLVVGCTSDQSPTEPSTVPAPTPAPAINLGQCRQNGLIVVQLTTILPAGRPLRLLGKGLEKFALVEAARLTGRKALAQSRALDLIDFLTRNRANLINPTSALTATRLGNVIDAILCLVGLPPTGVPLNNSTGVGVVPANNPQPVIITTPQGTAGLKVPAGAAPATDVNGNSIPGVVVTVTGLGNVALNTPLDQYGNTVDLTASQEVLWQGGGVIVALCVSNVDDLVFDRLRVGHEGGIGPKFGAIEILPQAAAADISDILGAGCTPPPLGQLRGRLSDLKQFAENALLPEPLHASSAGAVALNKTGGVGGTTSKFSKFRAVDPRLNLVANAASTSGVAGAAVDIPPSVTVRTDSLHPIEGIQINFAATAGTGSTSPASATTNADGVASTTSWILGPGQNTVTATAVKPIDPSPPTPRTVDEITFTPTSVDFTATGVSPFTLTIEDGNNQPGFTGQILTAPLVVLVTQNEAPVSGVQVTFQVTSGGGSITSPATTNGSGLASAIWTLGATLGNQTATASVPGAIPVTFTATAAEAPPARIVLQWGDAPPDGVAPPDLDAHLTGPFGPETRFHVFYAAPGNLAAAPFAALDRDDTDGAGPETITISQLTPGGLYRFSVHDFTNRNSPTSLALGTQSGATVTLYLASSPTPQVFTVPNAQGTLWTVFELEDGIVTPKNTMTFESDPSGFSVLSRTLRALQTDDAVIRDAVQSHRK